MADGSRAHVEEQRGKDLFRQTCSSCHDLDEIGQMTEQRVVGAIRNGGTGQRRMPAGLLEGDDARDVALYVAKVAGR